MKQFLSVILLIIPSICHAGLFSITVDDNNTFDEAFESLFDEAVNFWESSIIGTQENIDIELKISARLGSIDGSGRILAQAGPTIGSVASLSSQFLYASVGEMTFDKPDINGRSDPENIDLIMHEMAHVIGFGTLWNFASGGIQYQNVYTNGTGQYIGKYALQLYREIYDTSAEFVPVELDGGQGTADGHWDEKFLGNAFLSDELLTGYLGSESFVSDITLASFADIGYVVRLSDGRVLGVVSAPPIMSLLLMSVFIIFRRKLN